MMESFQVRKPLYPLLSIFISIMILTVALIFAKDWAGVFFIAASYALLCFTGYWKCCIKVLPFLILYQVFFSLIFYFASGRNLTFVFQMAIRLAGVVLAFIPGACLPPVNLVRNLTQLKFPRLVTLGMLITLTFIPVLNKEIHQIRNAMKTRGAVSFWKPDLIYRAFIIPLVVRLVNISDTLTLSVETKAFVCSDLRPSCYKKIVFTKKDSVTSGLFILLILTAIFMKIKLGEF